MAHNCGAQDEYCTGCHEEEVAALKLQNERLQKDLEDWKKAMVANAESAAKASIRDEELLKESNRLNNAMRGQLEYAMEHVGGWRELIAEWDDVSKSSALGEAMWAALDQIDAWKALTRTVLGNDLKRNCVLGSEHIHHDQRCGAKPCEGKHTNPGMVDGVMTCYDCGFRI